MVVRWAVVQAAAMRVERVAAAAAAVVMAVSSATRRRTGRSHTWCCTRTACTRSTRPLMRAARSTAGALRASRSGTLPSQSQTNHRAPRVAGFQRTERRRRAGMPSLVRAALAAALMAALVEARVAGQAAAASSASLHGTARSRTRCGWSSPRTRSTRRPLGTARSTVGGRRPLLRGRRPRRSQRRRRALLGRGRRRTGRWMPPGGMRVALVEAAAWVAVGAAAQAEMAAAALLPRHTG